MDLKGKILRTTFIEPTAKEWIMAMMLGIRLETIYNDKVYYIQENEDEEWELFAQEIKQLIISLPIVNFTIASFFNFFVLLKKSITLYISEYHLQYWIV